MIRKRLFSLLSLLFCFLPCALQSLQASRIDTVSFRGATVPQRYCVYLPDDYSEGRTYPVLYLLHGIHGNQYSWQAEGQMKTIVDSLVAAQKVRPLIIVMPFCQIGDTSDNLEPGSLFRCCMNYPKIRRAEFEHMFFEIDSCVSARYSVRSDREGRAIAGLSCGGRQAANLVRWANNPTDRHRPFFVCGLFSPVVFNSQLPSFNPLRDRAGDTQYFICGGKRDFFLPYAKRYWRGLQERDYPAELYVGPNGHNWRSWQHFLIVFLEKYFPEETPEK